MHRLVVALTTFLALVGAVVVAGYLFVFAAQPDRAARAVPEGTSIYATIYLQPSTGQKMNLAALLGRVPGFADPASLDQKIHEITARLLGEAGIDYEGDVRPWLGDQVALAVQPDGVDPADGQVLALIAVRDREAAAEALPRLADGLGLVPRGEDHAGVELQVADGTAWALLDDLLLVGSGADVVRAALDADAGREPSLADGGGYQQAMDRIPADHLGAVFLDLREAGEASGLGDELGGYSSASLALVVERDGLRLAGSAPFDADAAGDQAREAFGLASEPSSLPGWMPADTQAELVIFGLSQTLRAAEEDLAGQDAAREITDAITQIRAIAALGLGISIDDDVLPLFDREVAIAAAGLDRGAPHGQLLLRPTDGDAAAAALERMRDALVDRGAAADEEEVNGVTITSLEIPDLTTIAYAIRDGIIIVGLTAEDVVAALEAEASGTTLAETDAYRETWELAGTRGGNEVWLDASAMIDAAGDDLGVTGEARDILLQIGAVGMTAPARDDHSEFHIVLTVR